MKLYFFEERRGRKIELIAAISDINPLLRPFKAKIKTSKDGDFSLSVEKAGTWEIWEGGKLVGNRTIHIGTYDADDIAKVKTTLKLNIKAALEKAGLLEGLSEEKVK